MRFVPKSDKKPIFYEITKALYFMGMRQTEDPNGSDRRMVDQTKKRPKNSSSHQVRPHHEVHESPAGWKPTSRRLDGAGRGCAPHGARSPQLKIIVYNNNNNNYRKNKNLSTKRHWETPMSSLVRFGPLFDHLKKTYFQN